VWRRVAFPLTLAAAIAAATFAAANLSAASGVPRQLAPLFPGGPYFAIGCSFSHRNNDDPIVFPGQSGRSHNHTYIGNRSVDSSATAESLLGGTTTCDSDADSSAYWMPTLYVGGEAVHPLVGIVYYVNRTRERLAPLPKGLVVVAGNANARSRQPKGIVAWSCGAVGSKPRSAAIPACPQDQMLQLQVNFPNCWNGRAVDSPDHKQHLRYTTGGLCPASHPVALPTIALIVLYPPVPAGAQVASGRFGAHADFMNGWDQNVLAKLVAERS
jgi:hypothetical protein